MLITSLKRFCVIPLLLFPSVSRITAQSQLSQAGGNTHSYGMSSCRKCHERIVDSFMETAHFRTSALADAHAIKGSFSEGQNVLHTRSQDTYFKMERRLKEDENAFYQTAYQSTLSGVKSRTEQIDLVIGSGRKGQSYLYWKNGLLFQLPVSFLAERGGWANSPGYVDGEVNFGRLIPPRCLECHATAFRIEGALPAIRYSSDYELGISCQNCHGDGSRHVEYHAGHPGEATGKYILNPAAFSREQKLDNCALCHSGMRELKRPSFTYKPGEKLEDFLMAATSQINPTPEVHGNQVGLLELSKCFRSSPAMSCSTCHNVHQQERDLTQLARRCLQCHQVKQCKQAGKTGVHLMERCIDCHMPNQESKLVRIETATTKYPVPYRNHNIGVYLRSSN
jgi:hypothetical protein